jgi:hypothetical protein
MKERQSKATAAFSLPIYSRAEPPFAGRRRNDKGGALNRIKARL